MSISLAAPLHPPGFLFPRDKILAAKTKDDKLRAFAKAVPFLRASAPVEFVWSPVQLSYWGNDRYGICVTAEEAYAKSCFGANRVFWPEADCIAWARARGVLNGADLSDVMNKMARDGFTVNSQKYLDGSHQSVDWSDESILQAAILQGPVKLAINASALPSGAGSIQGWYQFGDNSNTRTDHSVSIGGAGTADYLFHQLGVTRPSSIPANKWCYKLFTWSTEGIVDWEWIMGCTDEAHVRNPTTIGSPPFPTPSPTTTTTTFNPNPNPNPGPNLGIPLTVPPGWNVGGLLPGEYLAYRNNPV